MVQQSRRYTTSYKGNLYNTKLKLYLFVKRKKKRKYTVVVANKGLIALRKLRNKDKFFCLEGKKGKMVTCKVEVKLQ